MKRPQGRPSKFTQAIADEICKRLAAGETLRSICRDESMPVRSTIAEWVVKDKGPGFSAQYTRARDIGLDVMADELIDISDDSSQDTTCDSEGNEIPNHEFINRSRLRVDARKWYLSKLAPKRYGDRLQLGDPDNPGATGISLVIMQAGQQDRPKE